MQVPTTAKEIKMYYHDEDTREEGFFEVKKRIVVDSTTLAVARPLDVSTNTEIYISKDGRFFINDSTHFCYARPMDEDDIAEYASLLRMIT